MLRILLICIAFGLVTGWRQQQPTNEVAMEWFSFPSPNPDCSLLGHWQHPSTSNHTMFVYQDPKDPDHGKVFFEYQNEGDLYTGVSEFLPYSEKYHLYLQPQNDTNTGALVLAGCYSQELWVMAVPDEEEYPITTFRMTPMVEKSDPVTCKIVVDDRTLEIPDDTLREVVAKSHGIELRQEKSNESNVSEVMVTCPNRETAWLVMWPEQDQDGSEDENGECHLTGSGHNMDVDMKTLVGLVDSFHWEFREEEPNEPTLFKGKVVCPDMETFWVVKPQCVVEIPEHLESTIKGIKSGPIQREDIDRLVNRERVVEVEEGNPNAIKMKCGEEEQYFVSKMNCKVEKPLAPPKFVTEKEVAIMLRHTHKEVDDAENAIHIECGRRIFNLVSRYE